VNTTVYDCYSREDIMKFPFRCPSCGELNAIEYKANNHYMFECSRCNQMNETIIRKEKFELLFDFGSWAFLDGYYREAVANFATSLERFLEFWIRTIRHKHSVSDEHFEKTWKLMSKQSQRQLGAFAMLYLFETGEFPDFLDSNRLNTSFRNDVVHTGKIPSRDEAVEYAELVFELIRSLLIELYGIAPTYVTADLKKKKAQVFNEAYAEGRFCMEYAFDSMFGIERFSPEKVAEAHNRYQANQAPDPPRLRLVATNTCVRISTSKKPWRPGNGSSTDNFTRSKKSSAHRRGANLRDDPFFLGCPAPRRAR
jgi:phage FluMu protein Com